MFKEILAPFLRGGVGDRGRSRDRVQVTMSVLEVLLVATLPREMMDETEVKSRISKATR